MFSSTRPAAPARQQAVSADGADIAERAIGFARQYRTPVTPIVYEVWYTYAARRDPGLNVALDTAMNTGQTIDETFLGGLYDAHLSPATGAEAVDRIGTDLHGTLARVSAAMDENLKEHSLFSGTLRSARASLVQGSSKSDLSNVIRDLHRANQQHLAAAQKLSLQLEKSRAQVSKLKGELVEVKRSSATDYLTGLPNRRALDEALDGAVFEARQRTQPLTLLMCAIDNLELVTRTHGLTAGDDTLRAFGEVARKALRPGQLAARFAGAKFALLLPGVRPEDAFGVAEALRQGFKALDSGHGPLGQLSVSAGAAGLGDGDDRDSLINRSDRHLAGAQDAGRDRTVCD
ncbi:diguanylate cyclase [Rhodobacteraceae bacterium 2CG4]|uniref:diguanylate cyclase n=1 Tax=Halovulum marinum TaxID=2662447 RepID=A0A6L5Z6B0_9RHOB|nr:GGDEF domain-containing protein [Halovulum marinum]MSU91522.1 diguanylate cyclase [Halovulum marinum]